MMKPIQYIIEFVCSCMPRRSARVADPLHAEVAACTPVLEVLRCQVSDVGNRGNEAMSELSSTFGQTAESTHKIVNVAAEMRGIELSSSLEQLDQLLSAFSGADQSNCERDSHSRSATETADSNGPGNGLDIRSIEDLHRLVAEVIARLSSVKARLDSGLGTIQREADQLSQSIGQVVVGLQFQDAISQRLEHVSETLGEIQAAFEEMVDNQSGKQTETRSSEWIERLSSSYCMEDEHRILSGVLKRSPVKQPSSSIELF